MYYEDIARWTRDRLAQELGVLLAAEQSRHDDNLPLAFPVSMDTSSVLGGVLEATPQNLPQYAIDCETKEIAVGGENSWAYDYGGHITIMVWAPRADSADAICKRHVRCVEQWINENLNPNYMQPELFVIHELRYSSTVLAGSLPLEQSTKQNPTAVESWLSGAEINLYWRVHETGPYQRT